MKKITKLSTIFASFGLIFSAISCSAPIDNSDFSKVKRAFNGVETSIKAKQKQSNKRSLMSRDINEGPSSSLQAIEALFNSAGESHGNKIDELEYNQPPMIQFQCLKKVFESIGNSFSFSQKYYDVISGDLYFDINTGVAKTSQDGDEYHYTYNFNLGLGIVFDEESIIADISFDIALNQGNNDYNISWFVKMYLEYDFNNSSPTYNLLMLTDNEQNDLPYRIGNTYEYDYVKVNQNKITEWRKFIFEADQKLVRDSIHPTFDSYKDSVTYKTGNHSWYKDSDLKKVKDISADNDLAFARELFALGLNSTDIKKEDYFNNEGTRNSKISDMYRSFSNVIGKEFIYALVATTDQSESHEDNDIVSIRFYSSTSGTDVFDHNRCSNSDHDITFGDLFTEGANAWNGNSYPLIYYLDENQGNLYAETDLSIFRVFVSYNNKSSEVSVNDQVDSIFIGEAVQQNEYEFSLTLKLKTNESVQGNMVVIFQDNNYTPPVTDNVIDSVCLEGDGHIYNAGGFSVVDDIKIKDIFTDGGTHREYNENTGGVDTLNNYKFIYCNKSGQKISEIPLSDIIFGAKDSIDSVTEYTLDESYADTKISDLWYNFNSKLYDDEGILSLIAKTNNAELDDSINQFKFYITVKFDSAGERIVLADAIRSAWPTKPIAAYGVANDLPYVNPSQNLSEDSLYKYEFYFDYEGTWGSLKMRLTNQEAEAYLASIENEYGYIYNGINSENAKEFIKDERSLSFSYDDNYDTYSIGIKKLPGKYVPTGISFDDLDLEYDEAGYYFGTEPLCVKGSNEYIFYFFDDGKTEAYSIKEPGTYKVTALIRYSWGSSPYIDRRLTATITIKSAS